MSLTNPKDVVTEERLKDFYDGIYPYLGGMPEVLANKFSRSDIYSTTEKIIGQWTDGKPLYQKIIDYGTLPSATSAPIGVNHNISNIANIVNISGIGIGVSTSTASIPLGCATVGTSGTMARPVYLRANNAKVFVYVTTDMSDWHGYITLQYTKTTDSAISIGVDTDYSTTEKIVGTDTDGKYIYQRTWTNLTTPSSAGNSTILTLANVNVLKSWGYVINNAVRYEFPWYLNSSNYFYVWSEGNGTSSVTIKGNIQSSSVLNKPIRLTLQYTKTS